MQRFEPDYVTSAYRAQLRSSLHRHLLGHEGARTFADPQSADLEGILAVLGRVAGDLKTEGIALHKTKGSMARFSPGRALLNVRTSFTPATPADLVRTPWVWKNAVDKLKDSAYMAGKALSDDELVRIYRGLKGARTIGRTVRGTPVAAMDKLQASPVLTNALRLFGRAAEIHRSRQWHALAADALVKLEHERQLFSALAQCIDSTLPKIVPPCHRDLAARDQRRRGQPQTAPTGRHGVERRCSDG